MYCKGFDCLIKSLDIVPHTSHQLDALEGLTIKDQSIGLDDMYDGMVLTTMAGYPLTIQLDPFRVNNVSMSMQESNLYYKNGVIHTFLDYPDPIVPWFGKSSIQVLIETNIYRNGDLSGFIALVKAIPSLYAKLQLKGKEQILQLHYLFLQTMPSCCLIQLSWIPDKIKL